SPAPRDVVGRRDSASMRRMSADSTQGGQSPSTNRSWGLSAKTPGTTGAEAFVPGEMVSVDCAEPLPGVSVVGLNVQTACVGRLPHDSVIGAVNAPPCAEALTM